MSTQTKTTIEELRGDIECLQPERSILRRDVSWRVFEQLLTDLEDRSGVKLLYDEGTLEFMGKSKHALATTTLILAVSAIMREAGVRILSLAENHLVRPTGKGAI